MSKRMLELMRQWFGCGMVWCEICHKYRKDILIKPLKVKDDKVVLNVCLDCLKLIQKRRRGIL